MTFFPVNERGSNVRRVGMSLDRQTASLLFAVALVGVPLSVEKEVPGQFFDGAVLLGRGAGRKGACEELPS